jgi:hypothetical protein
VNKGILIKLFICLSSACLCLFSYLEKQNELTELRLYVPKLVKEIKSLSEENTRIMYEVEQFESPDNMMRLARDSRFAHLKYPLNNEVLTLCEGEPLDTPSPRIKETVLFKPKYTLAFGAN